MERVCEGSIEGGKKRRGEGRGRERDGERAPPFTDPRYAAGKNDIK